MGFIFIGDSMPTKPASSFVSSFAHSLLAFHPEQVYCGRVVSSHCQFKLLIVEDVDRLLSQPESVWNALEAEYVELTRCDGCCVWIPDEYVIGEVLLQFVPMRQLVIKALWNTIWYAVTNVHVVDQSIMPQRYDLAAVVTILQ